MADEAIAGGLCPERRRQLRDIVADDIDEAENIVRFQRLSDIAHSAAR